MVIHMYSFIIISVFAILCWFSLLFLLYRLMSRIMMRRIGFISPIAAVLIIAITGSLFTLIFNGDIIEYILIFPLPTLAIFTWLPLVEVLFNWRGKGKDIAAFSFCYSIIFFWYFWGSNACGVEMIFLTIFSALPTDNLFLKMIMVILFNYAELVAIVGFIIVIPCIFVFFLIRKR